VLCFDQAYNSLVQNVAWSDVLARNDRVKLTYFQLNDWFFDSGDLVDSFVENGWTLSLPKIVKRGFQVAHGPQGLRVKVFF